jgi:hypothetical protein
MADWTNSFPRKGMSPMALNALLAILCQPLKRILPYLSIPIGVGIGSRRSGHTRWNGARFTLLRMINYLKPIIVDDIGDDGIDHSSLDGLEAHAKLLHDGRVMPVKRTKEEHD